MKKRWRIFGIPLSSAVFLLGVFGPGTGLGMPPFHTAMNPNDGDFADLVMRKVTVTPIRARSGDPIRIEIEWMYWGELTNTYYESTSAMVTANGKVIAEIPISYELGAVLGDEYRHTFVWDTKGMAPGRYHIRAEVPVRLDVTPYDNFLDVKEPLVLLPAGDHGSTEPESGGSAVAENPAWKKR